MPRLTSQQMQQNYSVTAMLARHASSEQGVHVLHTSTATTGGGGAGPTLDDDVPDIGPPTGSCSAVGSDDTAEELPYFPEGGDEFDEFLAVHGVPGGEAAPAAGVPTDVSEACLVKYVSTVNESGSPMVHPTPNVQPTADVEHGVAAATAPAPPRSAGPHSPIELIKDLASHARTGAEFAAKLKASLEQHRGAEAKRAGRLDPTADAPAAAIADITATPPPAPPTYHVPELFDALPSTASHGVFASPPVPVVAVDPAVAAAVAAVAALPPPPPTCVVETAPPATELPPPVKVDLTALPVLPTAAPGAALLPAGLAPVPVVGAGSPRGGMMSPKAPKASSADSGFPLGGYVHAGTALDAAHAAIPPPPPLPRLRYPVPSASELLRRATPTTLATPVDFLAGVDTAAPLAPLDASASTRTFPPPTARELAPLAAPAPAATSDAAITRKVELLRAAYEGGALDLDAYTQALEQAVGGSAGDAGVVGADASKDSLPLVGTVAHAAGLPDIPAAATTTPPQPAHEGEELVPVLGPVAVHLPPAPVMPPASVPASAVHVAAATKPMSIPVVTSVTCTTSNNALASVLAHSARVLQHSP